MDFTAPSGREGAKKLAGIVQKMKKEGTGETEHTLYLPFAREKSRDADHYALCAVMPEKNLFSDVVQFILKYFFFCFFDF
jgi:hypothetical protein